MDARDLLALGAPQALVDVWQEQVEALTEIQERALEAGALDGSTNLLVVAPTTSGKTFVGEMAATASAYSKRRHSIFLVPFRALAEEHYELFRARYGGSCSPSSSRRRTTPRTTRTSARATSTSRS